MFLQLSFPPLSLPWSKRYSHSLRLLSLLNFVSATLSTIFLRWQGGGWQQKTTETNVTSDCIVVAKCQFRGAKISTTFRYFKRCHVLQLISAQYILVSIGNIVGGWFLVLVCGDNAAELGVYLGPGVGFMVRWMITSRTKHWMLLILYTILS